MYQRSLLRCLYGLLILGLLGATAARAGSEIWVTTPNDDADVMDNNLSLREALGLANGSITRTLSEFEVARVPGGNFNKRWDLGRGAWVYDRNSSNPNYGSDYADTIRFWDSISSPVKVDAGLPSLGRNDDFNGGQTNGRVTLDGQNGNYGGLVVEFESQSSHQTIKNLEIRNFQGDGLRLEGLVDSYLLNLTIHHCGGDGINLHGNGTSPKNTRIGGPGTERCVIYACNRQGIEITGNTGDSGRDNSNNTIQNCYIGVNSGGAAVGAGNKKHGILLNESGHNTVRDCVVSGNENDGIQATGGGATGNIIKNNTVGLNAARDAKIGNFWSGIAVLNGAAGAQIGAAGEPNYVCGNGTGIYVDAADTVIAGNFIGTIELGTIGLGNSGDGIQVKQDNAKIGNAGVGNTICNNATGIALLTGFATVKYNFIGTTQNSYTGLGNTGAGIYFYNAAACVIGGSAAERNVISSNGQGLDLDGAGVYWDNIYANYIGTRVDGGASLPNGVGIRLKNGAHDNRIGGSSGQGNRIAGNGTYGIHLAGSTTRDNQIYSNTIGGDSAAMGNASHGVFVDYATHNTIGGAGMGNQISRNFDGVHIKGGSSNYISGNIIGLSADQATSASNRASGVALTAGAIYNSIGGSDGVNTIAGNLGAGIFIADAGTNNNTVYSNTIGTNAAGAAGLGNRDAGLILCAGASRNTVGWIGYGNTIAGNKSHAIYIRDAASQRNGIYGNLIGGATAALGNGGDGVLIEMAQDNRIGSTTAGGNTIRFNHDGVAIQGATATNNRVVKNLIGIAPDQTTPAGNRASGVAIALGANANVIGSDRAAEGNTICANGGWGVFIDGAGTRFNIVRNNSIGTNGAGAAGLGNLLSGVAILEGASDNVIGGVRAWMNVISGNEDFGVDIANAGTRNNQIAGNRIGTDPGGLTARGNKNSGVSIRGGASANTIGGANPLMGNLIGGNSKNGIAVYNTGTTGNLIQNNYIGLDKWGQTGLANGSDGVSIQQGACGTLVRNNVISGNQRGIAINDAATTGTIVGANFIGTDNLGVNPVGNAGHGVRISGAHDNSIGTSTTDTNIIAYNGGAGVCVTLGYDNTIRCNSIHSNGGLGIDLGGNGVTLNDPLDSDSGPNMLMNFPLLTGIDAHGTALIVRGWMTTLSNRRGFTVDFYANTQADPSGYGEGRMWIGSILASPMDEIPFAANLPIANNFKIISATVTDPSGNTSEFSPPPPARAAGWRDYP